MTKQEAKEYILRYWKVSSGKRITEMLLKYWKLEDNTAAELARKIFNAKDNIQSVE